MATEPGWYPDPLGGQGARYWDGIRWDGATQSEPPLATNDFPESLPAVEKPRRLWPVWVGLAATVVIAVGSAVFVATRLTAITPKAEPPSTPTTEAAAPTPTVSIVETVAAQVKTSMQGKFDSDPDLKDLSLKVVDVVLVNKSGNEYKGIATVKTSDGERHDIPIDVTCDQENVVWETPPGAFIFARETPPPPTRTVTLPAPPNPPSAPSPFEDFKLCPSGLSGAASADTSCAFADSVREAWYSSPGSIVTAYSPVTHQSYRMFCAPAVTDVWREAKRCTGRNAQGTILIVYIS